MLATGPEVFGVATGFEWRNDPRRVLFVLSRYKFVAKMFEGFGHVLEVGCGDGFGARVVAQAVNSVTGVDFDPAYVSSANETSHENWPVKCYEHDVLEAPVEGEFDGVYFLDVLEHISKSDEHVFISNAIAGLKTGGACIVGMPSLESQVYASERPRKAHVNCKTQPEFRKVMQQYFVNVFMFSANDEVVHTGFSKMAHYSFALCCGKRATY
ncbi:MAG: class I SAM-dependent methyltransferase [Rhodobacteraceae bacterium]|nr:class I SAM-dependent methyltransferase [Paracoccaceae bacterium]